MNTKEFMKKYSSYSPSYVIEVFNKGDIEEYVIGNKTVIPNIVETTSDTLYDIASLTKVFTSVLVYIAYEENKIDLNSSIYDIDNNFVNLKNIKVIDLLSHNQNVWTDGYLGDVKSKEEFYKLLYTAYIKDTLPTYVDVHYIILSTLLEKIYKTNYKTLCINKIFNKLDLKSATFDPNPLLCASNNYEHIEDKTIDYIDLGLIHDTKGRKGKELGIYLGHASIFINGKDLLKFLKSFFDYSLLKKETIDFMLKHKDIDNMNYNLLKKLSTKTDINEMYKEVKDFKYIKAINNMGTLYRNGIKEINDIPVNASINSIFFSGYTGPMFLIDFDKKVIIVVMCNAIHNSYMNRDQRKKEEIKIINDCYNELIKES